MGNFLVSRISSEGEIKEFYYNSYTAAYQALKKWEEDYYVCYLYALIPVEY